MTFTKHNDNPHHDFMFKHSSIYWNNFIFAININSFDIISGYVEFDLCTLDLVLDQICISI
jgi:hypothetical protein